MSNPGAAIKGAEAAQEAERAWTAVRGDQTIQYVPVNLPPDPTRQDPQWLKDLIRALGEGFSGSWPVLKWVLLALFAAITIYALWRLLSPLLGRPRAARSEPAPEWQPDRAEAEALLEDADALAAAGRFDDAVHLLLRRSVGQIAAARAEWVRPASTARELTGLSALPDVARAAFAVIAQRVERSRYALRPLGEDDWQAARMAYADFALQRLPAVAG